MKQPATSQWGEVFTAKRPPALTPAGRKLFPEFPAFWSFVIERHNVYLRRAAGEPKPWTADPHLRQYRFTNVYRELDTETQWLWKHWLEPHKEGENLWFAALVARHINWHPALAKLPYPVPWDVDKRNEVHRALADMHHAGERIFSSAYMINQSIPGGRGVPKHSYLCQFIFSPAWEDREFLRPRGGDTLEAFHQRLMSLRGLGSFMAAQVVADTKPFGALRESRDYWSWAAPGPGSLRGMNYVSGRAPDEPWRTSVWLSRLGMLQEEMSGRWPSWPMLDAQNLQNCLCEFSKYCRGYSRQRYPGV